MASYQSTELPESLEELKMRMSSNQCPVVTALKKLRAMEISLEKANFDIPPNFGRVDNTLCSRYWVLGTKIAKNDPKTIYDWREIQYI